MDDDCDDEIDEDEQGELCSLRDAVARCENAECVVSSCEAGFGNCDDENENGCETPLDTVTDCGRCGEICPEITNATVACVESECQFAECVLGWGNCDDDLEDGCETDLGTPPQPCSVAEDLGTVCGDEGCGTLGACGETRPWVQFVSRSGATGRWFRARADECNSCCGGLSHRLSLEVPEGTNYDLVAYRACGTIWLSSREDVGEDEQLILSSSDDCLSGEDGFDYWISVEYAGGTACGTWTLTIDHHGNCS